jgi:hypothetical protein
VVLTPEQQKSFNVLTAHYERVNELPYHPSNSKKMFETGFMAFNREPFGNDNLPVESGWIWNQSSAKVTVTLPTMMIATKRFFMIFLVIGRVLDSP